MSNLQRKAQKKNQPKLALEPVEPRSQSAMSPARLRYTDPGKKISTSTKARRNSTKTSSSIKQALSSAGKTPSSSTSMNRNKSKMSGSNTFNRQTKKLEHIDVTNDEEETAMPANPATSSPRNQNNKVASESEDDSDSDLPYLTELMKKTPELSKVRLQSYEKPEKEGKDDDDDDDEDIRSSLSKRKRIAPKASEDNVENEDEDIVLPSPLKRKRVVVHDSGESNDLVIMPSRSKKKSKLKTSFDTSEDSDNSVKFVTPAKKLKHNNPSLSVAQGRSLRRQQPKKPKRTQKQKQMELLRRRRAGESITELTDSESEEEIGPALYDSHSELEVLEEFEDESDGETLSQAKKKRQNHKKKSTQDDDDFVVEDDEDPLGVPEFGLHDIPLEFTYNAHKSKKAHFKDAVEWLVQRKINPAFNRKDPIYLVAFRRLDAELAGQAKSTFTSSVWREGFVKALNARPIFLQEQIGLDLEYTKCDACNRSRHPAKWKVMFQGIPYHKDSLEDVEPEDSDESGNNDGYKSRHDFNEDGLKIPDENTVYYVGIVCKGNAETAHRLTHWKYGLNDWVVSQLKKEGYFEPKNLAAREEMSTKRRSQLALEITDTWERNGELKTLFLDLKATLEEASQGPKKSRR